MNGSGREVGYSGDGLRMAELLASLSLAIDLGVGMPMEWVLRTCLLAIGLGRAAGLSETRLQNVYYLCLLRHVGCTSTSTASAADFGDETTLGEGFQIDMGNPSQAFGFMFRNVGKKQTTSRRMLMLAKLIVSGSRIMRENSVSHCEIASQLASTLGFNADVTEAFWQIYERWDGKGSPKKLRGEELVLEIRVLQLAQDAATLFRLGGVETAVAAVRERSGRSFDPALVEIFCRQANNLLTPLNGESVWDAVLSAEPGEPKRLTDEGFETALEAMADFTDLKSPFMLGHSRGVADLAASAARLMSLPPEDVTAVRRSALVHDVGRVAVTSGLWGKPHALTDREWESVRLHPYYTERILARSPALAQLSELAASHHERLDGTGYHRRIPGSLQGVTGRLLAAADVYRALIETRPHRAAFSPVAAAETLRREAQSGRLDGPAVEAVLRAAGHLDSEVPSGEATKAITRAEPGQGLTNETIPAKRHSSAQDLSVRELEVLRLLVLGLSNKEMGHKLFISPKTVGHHIQHIYTKINVSSRAGAALFAVQNRLLEK